jgi:hypothetical protein
MGAEKPKAAGDRSGRKDGGRRRAVVERVRERLLRTRWPRLQMSAIAALTGASGFVASWVLLRLGLDRMAVRYGIAVLVAYGVFLMLVRIWLAYHRRGLRFDADVVDSIDLVDAIDLLPDGTPDVPSGGGSFGGAGASASYSGPAPRMLAATPSRAGSASSASSASSSKASFDFSLDLDAGEAVVVVVVVAIALSVVVASIWLVLGAPALLAELLVDSALAGGLYRSMRRSATVPDLDDWWETALKKTAVPFLVVLVIAVAGGAAIQRVAPEAKSVGDVFRQK